MCDYSLHAQATRPAVAGETLITTRFPGTSTRGLASPSDPDCAVCLEPGTELAFADSVMFENRWIWTHAKATRVGKFTQINPFELNRHHDAIEFADGTSILITQLVEGQRVTVVQLPAHEVPVPAAERKVIPIRAPEDDLVF
jgi:hypothetical protein